MTDKWIEVSERLCNDEGVVAGEYMANFNRLRELSNNPDLRVPYEGKDFTCTGSMHVGGMHILCTSPAHAREGDVERQKAEFRQLVDEASAALAQGDEAVADFLLKNREVNVVRADKSRDAYWTVTPLTRFGLSYDGETLSTWPIAECLCCGHIKNLAVWKDKSDIGVCSSCRAAVEPLRGPCSPERECFCESHD